MQYSVKWFTCNNSNNYVKKNMITAYDFYKNTYKGYPSFEWPPILAVCREKRNIEINLRVQKKCEVPLLNIDWSAGI